MNLERLHLNLSCLYLKRPTMVIWEARRSWLEPAALSSLGPRMIQRALAAPSDPSFGVEDFVSLRDLSLTQREVALRKTKSNTRKGEMFRLVL